jgi:hypothetical protein
MQKYLGVAEENEVLKEEEILTAVGITMTVSAGRTFIHFMKSLEREQVNSQQQENEDECYPGCCDEEQDT